MHNLFISSERKLSQIKDTGVQYIPGHSEPLVDLIIDKFLPDDNGNILDLGGGGLRFAIPIASFNRKIDVVDLDESSLNIDLIYSRMRENGLTEFTDKCILKKNIFTIVDDVFHFLETTKIRYSLITAFRLIHFFNEMEINCFFDLLSKRLKKGGKLVISAFVQYNGDNTTNNEIFTNSKPVAGNIFYRQFDKSNKAKIIQKQQNLGQFVHLFSKNYLNEYGKKYNLNLTADSLPSTRIVRGYIFVK